MAINSFINAIDRFNTWIGKAASFIVYIMTGILCFELFSRGIFNSPTVWAHELTGYFFGAYFMLGGAYTLLEDGHVKVDIISSRFSERTKSIVDVITSLLILMFHFILLWFSTSLMITQIKRNEVSQTIFAPPVFPLSMVIVIGSIMFIFQAIAKLIRGSIFLIRGKYIDPQKHTTSKDIEAV